MAYLRLRQICLVARDLEAPARQLCEAFGLAIAYRDPHINGIGLHNVLIPAGRSPVFLEIVSPIRPGTTAERYLDRRGGDGGYMYIPDTSDLEGVHARAEAAGMRFIAENNRTEGIRAQTFQLHPRDTGGTMLEFDRHGAGEDMMGPYRHAGPNWQAAMRDGPVTAVLGAEIQSADPPALAARWANLFDRPVVTAATGEPEIRLDNAFARFPALGDDRGEGLSAVHLAVTDAGAVREAARAAGAGFAGDDPIICGVRFVLAA